MNRKATIRPSSGNVFADLELRGSADLPLQAELGRLVYLRIKHLGLTQTEAADRLGLKQPDVSKLMNGKHTGFSIERLFRFLNAMDQDVRITISEKPSRVQRSATVRVEAA